MKRINARGWDSALWTPVGDAVRKDLPEEVTCKLRAGKPGEEKRIQAEEAQSKSPCAVNQTDML